MEQDLNVIAARMRKEIEEETEARIRKEVKKQMEEERKKKEEEKGQ